MPTSAKRSLIKGLIADQKASQNMENELCVPKYKNTLKLYAHVAFDSLSLLGCPSYSIKVFKSRAGQVRSFSALLRSCAIAHRLLRSAKFFLKERK